MVRFRARPATQTDRLLARAAVMMLSIRATLLAKGHRHHMFCFCDFFCQPCTGYRLGRCMPCNHRIGKSPISAITPSFPAREAGLYRRLRLASGWNQTSSPCMQNHPFRGAQNKGRVGDRMGHRDQLNRKRAKAVINIIVNSCIGIWTSSRASTACAIKPA